MTDIQSIFATYASTIRESESTNIQLQHMLKSVLRVIEQNALDLNLNVYERATLKSVTIKLKAIEDEFAVRKTKKILQPTWTTRFRRGDQGRIGRYSSTYAAVSSREAITTEP